jgi:hypothetical protein
MEKIINQYPNMDTAGMDDKITIIQRLQDSKEKYREGITKGKEIQHKFLLESGKG